MNGAPWDFLFVFAYLTWALAMLYWSWRANTATESREIALYTRLNLAGAALLLAPVVWAILAQF
jgi:hypothetical protein